MPVSVCYFLTIYWGIWHLFDVFDTILTSFWRSCHNFDRTIIQDYLMRIRMTQFWHLLPQFLQDIEISLTMFKRPFQEWGWNSILSKISSKTFETWVLSKFCEKIPIFSLPLSDGRPCLTFFDVLTSLFHTFDTF